MKTAMLGFASLLLMTFNSHAAEYAPDIKCGPNSSGEEFVWADTESQRFWVNKEDSFSTATPLDTMAWTQGNSKFSVSAQALLSAGGRQAVLAISIEPRGQGGTLTLRDEDGDAFAEPVSCADPGTKP